MSKFFLYNGVKLPALPEWDKTVYPYAFIYAIGTNGDGVSSEVYTLIISASNQMVYDSIGIGFRYDAIGITKAVSTDGTEWVDRTYDSGGSEYFYVKREEPTDILYIRVAWANFDVLNANGSVYVAASEPVPVVDKFPLQGWLNWHVIGLCSRPLPLSKRVPVAYLYNGVRYPVVSEYDATEYPFAYIIVSYPHSTYNTYRASGKPLSYRSTNSEGYDIYAFDDDTKYIDARVRVSPENVIATKWSNWIEYTGAGSIQVSSGKSPAFWTNYGLYGQNGTLILESSEPVPVYE